MVLSTKLAAVSAWLSLLGLINAGTIASWTMGRDVPQIMAQDDDTGMIFYSLCNSNGTAVFPGNESRSLTFDHGLTPKKASGLAGVGYVDGQGVITAGIWHLNDASAIVHSLWTCNETGYFVNASNPNQWIISEGQPVHPDTGLAAVDLGRDDGYRVYYQQEDLTTSAFMYTIDGGWRWYGMISQDWTKGSPLSAGFTDPNAITVVSPRDEGNIEISMLTDSGIWNILAFPGQLREAPPDGNGPRVYLPELTPTNATHGADLIIENDPGSPPLDAWDGKARSIGLTLDSDAKQRIFYIGLDSKLHCRFGEGSFSLCTDINASKWPTADTPNAPFATAFDASRNEIWIYYMSGGNLTQVHRSSLDKWEDPIALPPTVVSSAMERGRDENLSKGALAGIGAGASVLTLSLIGLTICLRRRRMIKAGRARADDSQHLSPAPVYISGVPGWAQGGKWIPSSVPSPNCNQIHEMSQEALYHEMPAESAVDIDGGATGGEMVGHVEAPVLR
ncbi:hypothetical protein GGR50DRAFT_691405 [Xylaria sp. CBS 124048]|nr:hypothetical protein GGR50DRAFT_691405 [Xylaria sp. CBS 124048]